MSRRPPKLTRTYTPFPSPTPSRSDHSPPARILRRGVSHPAQAALAVIAYGFFRLLPLEWASACGGRLFRALGPRLKAHRVARRNLHDRKSTRLNSSH